MVPWPGAALDRACPARRVSTQSSATAAPLTGPGRRGTIESCALMILVGGVDSRPARSTMKREGFRREAFRQG